MEVGAFFISIAVFTKQKVHTNNKSLIVYEKHGSFRSKEHTEEKEYVLPGSCVLFSQQKIPIIESYKQTCLFVWS